MRDLFYRNTRLLILTICLILVLGMSSLQALPRMEDPALSQWYGKITTRFSGASADRVESLVTEKIEQKLQEIEEIKSIESTSQLGTNLLKKAWVGSPQKLRLMTEKLSQRGRPG